MQILTSLPNDLELERVSEIVDKIHNNNQDQFFYATSYTPTNTATPIKTATPTNTSQTIMSDRLTELSQGLANLSMQVW